MMTSDEFPSDPIRVAIVDDHPIMREGLAAVFARDHGIVVVGEGGSATDAIAIANEQLPDVILLDINMPGGGLDALEHIAAACPAIAVIMLTVKDDPATISVALKRGARGYVLKGISGAEIAAIVRTIHSGHPYITPTLAARLLIEAAANAEQPKLDVKPTGADERRVRSVYTLREEQILTLLADGLSNKQIAGTLALSESTVKHYMTNLMQKMQVRNRVEAALQAQKSRRLE